MILAIILFILFTAIYLLYKILFKNDKTNISSVLSTYKIKSDRSSYVNYALRHNLMGNLLESCVNPERKLSESIGARANKNLLNIKYVGDRVGTIFIQN